MNVVTILPTFLLSDERQTLNTQVRRYHRNTTDNNDNRLIVGCTTHRQVFRACSGRELGRSDKTIILLWPLQCDNSFFLNLYK